MTVHSIFPPTDPAASLRASATAFEAIGRPFDAELSRTLADGAAIDPSLYRTWAKAQADRVQRFIGAAK